MCAYKAEKFQPYITKRLCNTTRDPVNYLQILKWIENDISRGCDSLTGKTNTATPMTLEVDEKVRLAVNRLLLLLVFHFESQ